MNDAILVTGATGFIGAHLVSALGQQGHCVYRHSSANGDIARCPLEFEGVRHAFHLAGKSFVPDSWESPREFYDVNVLGTVNVLEFCRQRQIPLTFVSSYVYGKPHYLPITEDHPLQPLNPYSHSKILAEQAVRYFAVQFGVRSSIVRPFNIFGPGQDERFLIPTIIRQALDPRVDRIIVKDVRQKRDYLHVRDLVSLLISTLARPDGGVYNAGSGRAISIPELAEQVNACLGGHKPLYSVDQARPEETLEVVADITRAAEELSWEPRIRFGDGLRETIEWAQARTAAASR
jgi:nucleoside-diphosphate-sugar epimerase